jgi:large conductance mechanosensitive channel
MMHTSMSDFDVKPTHRSKELHLMSTPKKGLIAEFKEFILTGDLMSIAVAFIMGAAVKAVIDSFVKDIFTGILGLAGKCKEIPDPADPKATIQSCAGIADKKWKTVGWGSFLNNVINFLIIAAVVFVLVKAYKKATSRQLASEIAAGPSAEETLLTEIRDLLKTR